MLIAGITEAGPSPLAYLMATDSDAAAHKQTRFKSSLAIASYSTIILQPPHAHCGHCGYTCGLPATIHNTERLLLGTVREARVVANNGDLGPALF